MNIIDFRRIITAFADKPTDLQMERGQLLTEIRGELIQVKLLDRDGTLYVEENDSEETAISWIRNRIASLPQLADRIIDYTPAETNFVNPSGKLLDELEYDPNEQEQDVNDAVNKLSEILGRKIPGTSSIVYLTSDAGEGKTTLINQLAQYQARLFKAKKSNWLLLPIPLGGRPFLRLDDIVIASIVNNLRFRYFYYDSFIELVKLGMLVPAFDGFEEMFMQSSTGEALSATGNLINKLESSGSILIAARKAYFDYKSFSSQAKLFDTITSSVSFARLALKRWDKSKFLEYSRNRGISNGEEIYDLVIRKLNDAEHPILSRPVIVKKLIDVFKDAGNIKDLVGQLESTINYFPTFVNAIIEREANYKWIDTSGQPYKPILTVEQHYQLLSIISEEMWINNSDSLKDTILDLISELFCEQHSLGVSTTRQVKERVKQHALIVRPDPNNPSYKFDHEEFQEFFLGIAVGTKIIENKLLEVKSLLKKAQMPSQSSESVVSKLRAASTFDLRKLKLAFDEIVKGEGQTSFVKENIGHLFIRLINNIDGKSIEVTNYEFPANAFLTIKLTNIKFVECHFQNSSLHSSKITSCTFEQCYFDRIELNSSTLFDHVRLIDCKIASLYDSTKDKGYYDTFTIARFLSNKGVIFQQTGDSGEIESNANLPEDEDLDVTEKALRKFIRLNGSISDNIFRIRLGSKADYFFKRILPDLLKHNILMEIEHSGKGQKRHFKLGTSFSKIDSALNNSRGDYKKFLNQF